MQSSRQSKQDFVIPDDEIKLIVCDLDGTLLNNDKTISAYSKEMLQKARQRGIKVCFASGRYDAQMKLYVNISGGIDYVISCNGAFANDLSNGRAVFCRFIKSQTANNILTYLVQNKMGFFMYTSDMIYFPSYAPYLIKKILSYEEIAEKMGYPQKLNYKEFVPENYGSNCENILKIVAYEQEIERLQAFEALISNLKDVHCESTGYGLMSAANVEASKKTALWAIMQEMNIKPKNVCVFGDYTNDLSMFECAENRIAVANAVDEVKKQATFITLSNQDDGVAYYLDRLLTSC